MRPSLKVPTALLTLALAATACGGSSASGALAGKTAKQILAVGLAAAEKQTSVQYSLKATGGSQTQTISGEAGASDGIQTVTTGTDEVEVEVVGGVAYFQGNAGGLQNTLGFTAKNAATYAAKWISVARSDSLYQPITQSVTIRGIMTQLTPSGTLTASAPGKVAGHEVIGVAGSLPGNSASGVTGTAVLYIATTGSTLPLGFSGSAKSSTQSVTDIGAFAKWGSPLVITAPTGAIAYSSLPKS